MPIRRWWPAGLRQPKTARTYPAGAHPRLWCDLFRRPSPPFEQPLATVQPPCSPMKAITGSPFSTTCPSQALACLTTALSNSDITKKHHDHEHIEHVPLVTSSINARSTDTGPGDSGTLGTPSTTNDSENDSRHELGNDDQHDHQYSISSQGEAPPVPFVIKHYQNKVLYRPRDFKEDRTRWADVRHRSEMVHHSRPESVRGPAERLRLNLGGGGAGYSS